MVSMRKFKVAMLSIARRLGLFRIALWLTRDRLRILCYHGFALRDEGEFRPGMFMSRDTFEARLDTLRQYGFRVLPLGESIERLYAGTLPDRTLAITVDDGFHSVRQIAAPALASRGLPATVYVTTYYVEKPSPIFRLVVQYMFWKTPCRTLSLENVPWAAGGEIDLTDPAQAERAVWDCIRYGETQCSEEQRGELSRRLGDLLAVPYAQIEAVRILHLMTPQELRELADKGIDVQLHTHRHVFPQDAMASAEREIADNRAALSRILGQGSFDQFCYPSGVWAEHQWAWLDRMGVKASTTCLRGLNSPATPRHALRRLLDSEDVHQVEFEAYLAGLW